MDELTALSVLDGRYSKLTGGLDRIFSEYGLIRNRVYVELQWLKFLGRELGLFDLSRSDLAKIDAIAGAFDENAAKVVKSIEQTTNHDVKAVEYYIKEQLDAAGLSGIREWTHFACTSEDINNTAYALMIRQGRDEVAEALAAVLSKIEALALAGKSVSMMARTHGQPATPTTVGKEFVNFAWRLRRELEKLKIAEIHGKVNGASGNFNAHVVVFPEIDWIEASRRFVAEYLLAVPLVWKIGRAHV